MMLLPLLFAAANAPWPLEQLPVTHGGAGAGPTISLTDYGGVAGETFSP
jgi:hypothetical protein